MKTRLLPVALIAVAVAGGAALITNTPEGEGRTVTFTASWYASPQDQRNHVGTDNAHVVWHVLPDGETHNQVHHGGHYNGSTTVTGPGLYTAILVVTTDQPTKLACRASISNGRTMRDPKSDDKNPGTGKCHIVLTFTVRAT